MKTYAIAIILLLAAGLLTLSYSQFSFAKESEVTKIAPMEISAPETKAADNIPGWAGMSTMIVVGAVLVFAIVKP